MKNKNKKEKVVTSKTTNKKIKTIQNDEKVKIVPKKKPIVHEKDKKTSKNTKSSTKKKKTNNVITDMKKKKILADYLENPNYREVGRLNDVSYASVKRIVNKMSSGEDIQVSQIIIQKKEDNTNSVLEYIDSLAQTKKDLVSNILIALNKKAEKPDFMTTFKDLATGLGIIVDKEYKAEDLRLRREEIALKREELELKKKEMEKGKPDDSIHDTFMAALYGKVDEIYDDDEDIEEVSKQPKEVISNEKEN